MIDCTHPFTPASLYGHWTGNFTSVDDNWQARRKCVMQIDSSGVTATYVLKDSTRRGQLIPVQINQSDQVTFYDRVIQSVELKLNLSLMEGDVLKCVWRGKGKGDPKFVAVMTRAAIIDESLIIAYPQEPAPVEARTVARRMSGSESYFCSKDLATQALNRCKDIVAGTERAFDGEGGKLFLYFIGKQAYSASGSLADRVAAFSLAYHLVISTPIGKESGYSGVASDLFDTIARAGSDFHPHANVNLSNFKLRPTETSRIYHLLSSLSVTHSTDERQWAIVTKLLNFVNPSLFPSWDYEVAWHQVIGNKAPFRVEFDNVLKNSKLTPSDSSLKFIRNYVCWAAYSIQRADARFMNWFAEWMDANYQDEIEKYQLGGDVQKWYAAAFEFIIMGATSIASSQ